MAKELLRVEDNDPDAKVTVRAFRKQNIAKGIVTVTDGAAASSGAAMALGLFSLASNEPPAEHGTA
ncbi:MAG TPA: hypothetical protein VHV30_01810 [Polyangiaceae bacterium]|jgi:hypothetical protein|nr:hypothetical protein [Polyangiaceae bacterium]